MQVYIFYHCAGNMSQLGFQLEIAHGIYAMRWIGVLCGSA